MKNKKVLIAIFVAILLIGIVGVSFAAYTYIRQGTSNSKQVVGDIYMHYTESNQLTLTNAVPSNTYDPTKYFEFTIDGKNTTTNKDISYDIVINRGDNHETKTERLADRFLKFTLLKKVGNGNFEMVVDAMSYGDLSNGIRLYVDTISKNTTSEIVHTYRLYMWISNEVSIGTNADYDIDTWNDEVYASIKVNVTGDFIEKEITKENLKDSVLKSLTTTNNVPDNYVLDDGIYYISGCKEGGDSSICNAKNTIDFNYVWYSGKLWRITAIYPDGRMKMITQDPMTAIAWGSTITFEGSWMYQWLNEDFKDTLYNYQNIIDLNSTWNATITTAPAKPQETTMVTATVGSLNSYEYVQGYAKLGSYNISSAYINGYLNIGYYWRLMTPSDNNYVYSTDVRGFLAMYGLNDAFSVRPSIIIKNGITLIGGDGTKNNPYKISGDKEEITNNVTLLNTRNSGEYVTFKDELYRIIGVENNTTKIVKVDYIRDGNNALVTKYLASSITFGKSTNTQSNDYWDYYLNNTWLKEKFEIQAGDQHPEDTYNTLLAQGTYYLGTYGSGASYKNTICKNSNTTDTVLDCVKIDDSSKLYTGYVGLLRAGEMFASQLRKDFDSAKYMVLISPYNSSKITYVNRNNCLFDSSIGSNRVVRPTLNIKSTIVIKSGDGTIQYPFIIE